MQITEKLASQYTAGYTDAEDNYKSIIADKDATIADMGAKLSDKSAEIAALKKELEDLKNKH